MAVGRVLTACAGAVAVPVAGRLVRHRGLLAVLITWGLLAVYPYAIAASVAVLQEPWLVPCGLAGAVAVFDGDRVTDSWQRFACGGAAFGFAGAIKVWAVIPAPVIMVLAARRPRRALVYLGGTSIGIPALVVLAFAGGWVVTRQPPPALDWFALVTAAGVVAAFMRLADFYYHYSDFLAPFLALCVELPTARLVVGLDHRAWRPAGNRRAWQAPPPSPRPR
jgi:hypothetical protein